jgi:RNase H-fold protein (predicted Holliday junction resolvase)
MESREHLIKLLDKPKARKYRDIGLYRLLFDKLETVKPGALAELNKKLIKPPPEYVFYDNFILGHATKLTKILAGEIINMGIPDSLTIRGSADPEALLAIINEMAATNRLDRHNKEFKFALSVACPIDISKLLKLAESLPLAEQDKLADDLDKLDIFLCTNVHNKFELASSALKSVKLVAKALGILGCDVAERMGPVGTHKAHREWRPSGSIIDRTAWLFTDTDNDVLIEGITTMLSTQIDKMAIWEIEKEYTGAFIPIKIIQIKSIMLHSNEYTSAVPLVVGAPHKPNDKTSSRIYKAMALIEALKDKIIKVKTWKQNINDSGVKETVDAGVEYATIKIVAQIDTTLARISTKQISTLIDKCDDLVVYSFYPCLPNSDKFHDASVEAPASIDIMELDQVKDPSKLMVSKGIHLNGVDLSNVTGPEAQSKLQQFITACLIGPPTNRKQEICKTEDYSIHVAGTFNINQVSHKSAKTVAIHVASGVDVTYENLKPVFKAIESVENLAIWLGESPIKDLALASLPVKSEDIHKGVVKLLTTKLHISCEIAAAIADMCSAVPRCGLIFSWENLELEIKAALANYLSNAISQLSVMISIPSSCRVSTRLAMEVKDFAAKRPYVATDPAPARLPSLKALGAPKRQPPKVWRVSLSRYYTSFTNLGGDTTYEIINNNGIDEEANSLDEAFALDKHDRLKNATAATPAAAVYAGIPCVGFDKNNNYVFKIKEFSDACTAKMSTTNSNTGADPSNRAVIIITPHEWSTLHSYFHAALEVQLREVIKEAGATVTT